VAGLSTKAVWLPLLSARMGLEHTCVGAYPHRIWLVGRGLRGRGHQSQWPESKGRNATVFLEIQCHRSVSPTASLSEAPTRNNFTSDLPGINATRCAAPTSEYTVYVTAPLT
jgi:hypothetical protein